MDKQELDQLIDKSILGKLNQDEKSKLDTYIMKYPSSKLEMKMRTDILKGLEYNADQEFKSLLNGIHNEEISGSAQNVFVKRKKVILLGLVVALGIFALFKYVNDANSSLPQQSSVLYASYFEPYVPLVETRSTDNIQEEIYQNFIESYRSKDYPKSLEAIASILDNADNNTLLLASISAMESNKHEESIRYLDKIIASNDYYYLDHAKWYKSLVLIKTNNIQEAKILLRELANNHKADHHDESKAILKEI